MDIATIIGLVLGFGLIFTAIMIGGGDVSPFIDMPSAMIVFGGALAASLINFPMKKVIGAFAVVLKCFLFKLPESSALITQFKEFSTLVRKDGLLALENRLGEINNDFMKRGIEALIAGSSAEQIRVVLETELSCIEQRHSVGKKIVDACGAAAPAFGMIGTLIGLVQMLRSLDDPSKIGGGMATALLTTLYGALIANVVCIPLAGKLETRSQEESSQCEMIIAGISGLAEGTAPRALEEQLLVFLAPKQRAKEQEAAA